MATESTTPTVASSAIELSAKAAARIKALAAEKGTPEGGLRLGVRGGGCSGLSYHVDWAAAPTRLDRIVERDGARLFVDPKSARFLAGTTVDWQQTLMQSGFVFRNPNVKSSCSCGDSFTV